MKIKELEWNKWDGLAEDAYSCNPFPGIGYQIIKIDNMWSLECHKHGDVACFGRWTKLELAKKVAGDHWKEMVEKHLVEE